jgi:hypothetical protein
VEELEAHGGSWECYCESLVCFFLRGDRRCFEEEADCALGIMCMLVTIEIEATEGYHRVTWLIEGSSGGVEPESYVFRVVGLRL